MKPYWTASCSSPCWVAEVTSQKTSNRSSHWASKSTFFPWLLAIFSMWGLWQLAKYRNTFPTMTVPLDHLERFSNISDYGIQDYAFPTAKAALLPASLWQLSLYFSGLPFPQALPDLAISKISRSCRRDIDPGGSNTFFLKLFFSFNAQLKSLNIFEASLEKLTPFQQAIFRFMYNSTILFLLCTSCLGNSTVVRRTSLDSLGFII